MSGLIAPCNGRPLTPTLSPLSGGEGEDARVRVPSAIILRGLRREAAGGRQVLLEPVGDGSQGRMGELGFELAPDPRHMDQIAGLAVALQQAREIAEEAGVALGAGERIGGGEVSPVELG